MSLLMDALKKAEQAKQAQGQREEPTAAPPEGLALEPVAPAETPATLPELPQQLEVLDDEFMAHAPSARAPERSVEPPPAPPKPATASPAPAAGASATQERNAARQLFEAKQPPAGSKSFVLLVGAFTLIAVAAIGGYFWWQLRPKPAFAPPLPPAERPVAPIAAVPPSPALPVPAPPAATAAADDEAERTHARAAAASLPVVPPTPEPASPIRVTTARVAVNTGVTRAYEALAAADLATASAEYERVLRSEPKNGEALRGMASIALRQGRPDRAEDYFQRALDADPKDAHALAGLLGLRSPTDPAAGESRLKALLAEQPEAAVLHFALGNTLARQARWPEAQQAYFKAHSLDPDNADYLFNLAVSLDQMHQPRLAAQYYEKAIGAAELRAGAFDRTQAAGRLRELQR